MDHLWGANSIENTKLFTSAKGKQLKMRVTKSVKNENLKSADRGDITREALIEAAMTVFAHKGYDSASNREIAQLTQVNQALIGYHFGNKEGLYLAVFRVISEKIQLHISTTINEIEENLNQLPRGENATPYDQQRCISLLLKLVEGMARIFTDQKLKQSAQLILHEQQNPTQAFDILYDGFMKRSLKVVTKMVQYIRPQYTQEDASLIVAAILGQTLVFRAARTTLLRHLEWSEIGPLQVNTIVKRLKSNVRAILCSKDEI